ncbi:unnamed protein product [Lampetra fluviatilis]
MVSIQFVHKERTQRLTCWTGLATLFSSSQPPGVGGVPHCPACSACRLVHPHSLRMGGGISCKGSSTGAALKCPDAALPGTGVREPRVAQAAADAAFISEGLARLQVCSDGEESARDERASGDGESRVATCCADNATEPPSDKQQEQQSSGLHPNRITYDSEEEEIMERIENEFS